MQTPGQPRSLAADQNNHLPAKGYFEESLFARVPNCAVSPKVRAKKTTLGESGFDQQERGSASIWAKAADVSCGLGRGVGAGRL